MKTYLRHYRVRKADVRNAITAWLCSESGRENGHRIEEEYGSADALCDNIYGGIRRRTLTFRPICRYQRREPTNGKVRVIGVESVKQQVCDYLVVTLLEPLYRARGAVP